MLLHCTKALARKLRQDQAASGMSEPAWAVWHAHLLRLDRRQCVMFCHDQTRYCLFLAGLRAYALLQRSPHVLLLDPLEVSSYLNARPATTHGKWIWPRDAMKTLLSELFA